MEKEQHKAVGEEDEETRLKREELQSLMDWHGRLQTQIAQTDEQIWEFKEQIEESTRTTKEEKRNI